ncbi:beta-D-glucosyl crocetin beta-1,6-glucosyltransferase-like [Camellia sinensis]|uniref:Uncharacterized protein n=1 Tax=Camellia sinensis var. sinensis TaxID=542762 RepID=A0A4V6RYU3_CAMSN|nr:beta-D-glucosyl crocetin beta-1,6-glucosyltransferase-like [Camellia sinensis]THG23947.1 hypothetical protein TEA_015956 [Camellia sinensis var. sinensis]
MPTLKKAFDFVEPNFSLLLKTHKPDLLIYDFLHPWALVVPAEYGIPAVDFVTSSATMTAFMHHLYKDLLITFPFSSIYLRDYEKVEVSHLLNPLKNLDKDKTRCFECLDRSSEIVLIKNFKEGGDCVDENDESEIIGWLNKKERRSTVFVCFGTEYFLSNDEIEDIAYGLELSGVNLLWVVRFAMGANTSVEKAMPRGFIKRVGERVMVVEGWAFQVKILLHPSIGGFVISFILATGVGPDFGVTKDLKRIMDILNKLSGNDLGSKLDYFFNKTYVLAGFLFIGFRTSGISSITSLLALSKKE